MTDALSAAIESILRTDDLSEEIHQAQINTLRDAYDAALAEPQEPDLSRCPKCNGPADNGHDREVPPNPYFCTKCMAEPQEPVHDKLEQLRAFCKWERVNSPHPDGLPHVAEWAVMEIDRLRAAKVKPVKRSQDWHDGVIEGHLRERDYWLAKQAEPVQEPQRKSLSKEDIERITDEHWPDFVAFTRAVEAAHGIGKQE